MIENCYAKTTVNSCTNFHKINFIKICLQIFKPSFSEDRWRCSCPCGCREGTTNLREVISTRAISKAAKNPPLPIESLHSDEPENLFDAERHCRPLGYKFCSQNFRGQKFCMPKAVFSVSSGFHWFIFRTIFVRKKITRSPIFSACVACSSKISIDLRSPEIFEELENLYPMFLHGFSCIRFDIRNLKFDIQFSTKIAPYFA
jgi:hypothetical protein